ncbi:PadR family transcriptional regulator [Microbacterium sp. 2FI]|uniref:PadR family transcriptional regulator n=1 Tax=Microbacterium sp. 2FI TaxID=2502193 RepID=UPI00148588C3|nr:PadR family transcriptional regulator [Microbacterium sp. 2FI]
MQYVILGLLLAGPLSLYDLHKQFGQGVSLFYSASFGSLQRALQHLVAQGLVTVSEASEGRRGRKLHTITDDGRAAWREWMLAPTTGADAETTMLAKVFLTGSLTDPADRAAVIARLRERVSADLDGLTGAAASIDAQSIPAEYAAMFAFQRATLDYGIRAHELAARWLDELPGDAV